MPRATYSREVDLTPHVVIAGSRLAFKTGQGDSDREEMAFFDFFLTVSPTFGSEATVLSRCQCLG